MVLTTPFLCLGGVQARFGLFTGPLELARAFGAGGPLSVGLGLVQVITLAGVLSLDSQVVEVPAGHGFESRASFLEDRWSLVRAILDIYI